MKQTDLTTISGFLEENEAELAEYLMTGAGGKYVTEEQAEREASAIIQRLQDFSDDSDFADYLQEDDDA